jgi:hypothetical protein
MIGISNNSRWSKGCALPIHIHGGGRLVDIRHRNVIVQKMSAAAPVPSPTPDEKSVGGFKQPRGEVPKMLEPFSRSKLTRSIREPSLIQKAEAAIRDRCCLLEGDESFECWEAFF